MGKYINLGNSNFKEALAERYIDKSMLIAEVNGTLGTKRKMSCVTRCRRFGKSMAADMLCAYYDKSCNSRELFRGLAIENDPSFETHLNKYRVIFVSLTTFTYKYRDDPKIVDKMQRDLIDDIHSNYPDVEPKPNEDLMDYLFKIATTNGDQFIMIIDEWDAIMREFSKCEPALDSYVKFLRRLFKDPITSQVFLGAYITGILPIMRDRTQSALNNFFEFTMIDPGRFAPYYGFNPSEVESLCTPPITKEEMKEWYDGYQIGDESSIYNPNSVMIAIEKRKCGSYWNTTGSYEAVSHYIHRNYDGLKDAIISMLGGGRIKVNTSVFRNDLEKIQCKDDVLTLLIHLGYLAYDPADKTCYIPNFEVREEMLNAIREVKWSEVMSAVEASDRLLQAVLRGDSDAVANGVQKAHQKGTSILSYNDENSLACVLTLAFFSAQDHYVIHRELATGKGYADLIFVPRSNVTMPGIIMELKCNKDTDTALKQIKEKDYADKLLEYTTDIIYVGINYDTDTKQHTCEIEHNKPSAIISH